MKDIINQDRKLLVSVFNQQEAREALTGSAGIIDSEDPRSALGNISPLQIMDIRDSVLNSMAGGQFTLSTNIGEDQLLFDIGPTGIAKLRSEYEICGKATQAALGVAMAMGRLSHPCNIIKVGLDMMPVDLANKVLYEVVSAIKRSDLFIHNQVMSVCFVQDIPAWKARYNNEAVKKTLVSLNEFYTTNASDPGSFDLSDYAVDNLKDENGQAAFTDRSQVSLQSLIAKEFLPSSATETYVKLNQLSSHAHYFDTDKESEQRSTKDIIKQMIDATADAGANSLMLDTRIQSKVARICTFDTSKNQDSIVDINRFDKADGLSRQGILSLDELQFFVDYSHYRNLQANIAGSVQSYQAEQLWLALPELDQISNRGAASAVASNPADNEQKTDNTRQHRVIKDNLVRGVAPPEKGSVLNFPLSMKSDPEAVEAIELLVARSTEKRRQLGLPSLKSFYVDEYANQQEIVSK